MNHRDDWDPRDGEPMYPELDETPNEIPGQRDIFGGEVPDRGEANFFTTICVLFICIAVSEVVQTITEAIVSTR